MSEVKAYLDKKLRELVLRHSSCPDCGFMLIHCHHQDEHDGAWCGLCGYHRDTLRLEEIPPDDHTL